MPSLAPLSGGSVLCAEPKSGGQAVPVATIGDFELISLAGRGTFAEVWQVRDRRTGRRRALKRLRADRQDPKSARQILENEAEIGRRIASPHLVACCESHLDEELPYLVLEWLSGRTLEARLAADRHLFCHEALWIARQCAQGLHALLVAGFTHGDVKPSNIFLCDDGLVKLIDLGFARPDRQAARELDAASQRMISGTPEYMAPETLAGEPGGPARDVYSLGITLYRMLTGKLPFQGETAGEVLKQQQQALPQTLRSLAPHVPRELDALVSRLLSKQPLRRGGGLSWLVQELIGLELAYLAADAECIHDHNTARQNDSRYPRDGRHPVVAELARVPATTASGLPNSGEFGYASTNNPGPSPLSSVTERGQEKSSLPKSGNLPELPRLTEMDPSD